MLLTDLPTKFPIPFANSAGASYIRSIPEAHQTATATDAPASLTDGFPPETFTPLASGGVPPSGKDVNGILNQLSAWARWGAAGGPAVYDSAFATAVGGYPKGATLMSTTTAGLSWVSLADNNTTDPDSVGAANWQALGGVGSFDANGATLPSGLIIKWGMVSMVAGEGLYTVNFPSAFPTACFSVGLTEIDSGGAPGVPGHDTWVQLDSGSVSKTGFRLRYQSGSGDTGYGYTYQAYGH